MDQNQDNNANGKRITKICPQCKQAFECIINEGCWCEKVVVTREMLKQIRRNYLDCLCGSCLKSYGP
ncbi:MAG: cysteine-rich CWC family protein, partial [Bacteroidia bacterium]